MPGKYRRSEQRCQDLGWKAHDVRKKNILFRAHTLCMSYVTNNFISVSSSVRSKQLLCQFVHSQGQKSEQKPTTKNFVGFHSHSPLLTMARAHWYNCLNLNCYTAAKEKSIGKYCSHLKFTRKELHTKNSSIIL